MTRYLALALIVALPITAQSQKDLLVQLRQDVAALQEENRKTKASRDERIAVLTDILNKTFELVTRLNEKLAASDSSTAEHVSKALQPVRDLSAKVDGMGEQFANLSNVFAEINSRLGKLDGKIEDVRKTMQTIPAEAPPPSGEKLFDDANRDNLGGNSELALKGYTAYLEQFKGAIHAADAQFFIGEVYLGRNDFEHAIKAYDALLWTYPESIRAPNAHFMKGVALLKLEHRADSSKEFMIVVDKYPGSELASRAKDYLKNMAVPTNPPPEKKRTALRR